MEKKTTRRIIGVLVVIALVIILLPLINSGGESQTPLQTAETKAPPFPQPKNEENSAPSSTPVVAQNSVTPTQSMIQKFISPHKDVTVRVPDSRPTPDQVTAVADVTPVAPVAETKTETANTTPAPAVATQSAEDSAIEKTKSETVNLATQNTKIAPPQKPKGFTITRNQKVVEGEDALTQIKSTAWVVQMGSFRNKENANRLTDALRSKGYKAFTFETKNNGQTRVYIGPEFKQVAATTIVNKLASDMKIRGIIVTYKPLELEA